MRLEEEKAVGRREGKAVSVSPSEDSSEFDAE